MAGAETGDAARLESLSSLFDNVDSDSERLRRYAIDDLVPDGAVRPTAIEDVERLQSLATERDLAVIAHGGRTMRDLGMPPRKYDVALDLSDLDQVVDYEPNDFTITVQAGMTLAELQRHLATNGQFLPLDHPHFERATLGGICSVGRGGLRRGSFGGPRDWLIGMRMVKADGTAIKGGGKVVKNVSGYDLPKLFAGSLGTLGIIVEVTLKLRPQPASDQIVALNAPSLESALAAARAAANAAPFLNGCVVLSAGASANAHDLGAKVLHDQPAILLRANGLETAASEVLAQALRAVHDAGIDSPERTTTAIVETWQAVADLELQTTEACVRLRLGLPPANLPRGQRILADNLPEVTSWVAAADSGLMLVDVPTVDADTVKTLRTLLGPLQGRLTIESAPLELKRAVDVWGPAGPGARLMHNVKAQFDPSGILSPGRFVDGI